MANLWWKSLNAISRKLTRLSRLRPPRLKNVKMWPARRDWINFIFFQRKTNTFSAHFSAQVNLSLKITGKLAYSFPNIQFANLQQLIQTFGSRNYSRLYSSSILRRRSGGPGLCMLWPTDGCVLVMDEFLSKKESGLQLRLLSDILHKLQRRQGILEEKFGGEAARGDF